MALVLRAIFNVLKPLAYDAVYDRYEILRCATAVLYCTAQRSTVIMCVMQYHAHPTYSTVRVSHALVVLCISHYRVQDTVQIVILVASAALHSAP